jgi:hypothetical protein
MSFVNLEMQPIRCIKLHQVKTDWFCPASLTLLAESPFTELSQQCLRQSAIELHQGLSYSAPGNLQSLYY